MKKLIVSFGILCLSVALASCSFEISRAESPLPYESPKDTHPNDFFEPRLFNPLPPGKEVDLTGKEGNGSICGAVVPHHLLAYEFISEVFAKLQANPPPLLILVGPNHENRGARISTSSLGWQTPFGTVEVDGGAIDNLLKTNLVKIDDHAFTREHSIGNLMPFIKYYLPNTKVVPIIYHHDVSKKESAQMARFLAKLAEDGAVIIASVDFSHYLTRKEAEQKDVETLKIMEEKDLDTLFTLGNDHLDSPAALGTLFLAMEDIGIENFTVIGHTNSGILLQNDLIETTSYITLLFGG